MIRARFMFEPRDLWVGVFWAQKRAPGEDGSALRRRLDVYICLLPMLPLRVSIERGEGRVRLVLRGVRDASLRLRHEDLAKDKSNVGSKPS